MNKKIWFVSDTHFGHFKEFMWKPRGFNSIEEHDQAIIDNWNKIIAPDDEVYHLGDVFLYDDNYGIECLIQLNGKIHILLGNHDTSARAAKFLHCPNVVTIDYARQEKFGKYHFWLSHYPTITATYEDGKPWSNHLFNIYGHTHQKTKFYLIDGGDYYSGRYAQENPYMYCVCLDAHDNKPVELQDILNDIQKKKEELDRQ